MPPGPHCHGVAAGLDRAAAPDAGQRPARVWLLRPRPQTGGFYTVGLMVLTLSGTQVRAMTRFDAASCPGSRSRPPSQTERPRGRAGGCPAACTNPPKGATRRPGVLTGLPWQVRRRGQSFDRTSLHRPTWMAKGVQKAPSRWITSGSPRRGHNRTFPTLEPSATGRRSLPCLMTTAGVRGHQRMRTTRRPARCKAARTLPGGDHQPPAAANLLSGVTALSAVCSPR